MRKHFHAARISREGPVPELGRVPLVVVANHPSWWDPIMAMVLSAQMPAWRRHYAPIDVKGLVQYPFLEKVGCFGIEPGTTRGSLVFLRISQAILAHPESALWITAQGHFVDARERPPRLKDGVGHLVHRLSSAVIVPLALEYPFWNDRCPEALVRFGAPIEVRGAGVSSPRQWTALIEQALENTQDRLAVEARRRDPEAFTTLIGGTAGVGGVYDLWRRFKARVRGESFDPEHVITESNQPEGERTEPGRPH